MARILVIDDDASVRTTIETILASAGHTVTQAKSGRDGTAAFSAGTFDLIIVDLFMPEMDGIEATRAIRARAPDIPVLAISGYMTRDDHASPDYLDMATKLGATRSLAKPFKARDLLQAVDACIAARAI